MSNPLSKIIAALLAVLLLYVFPLIETAKRQDDVSLLASYRQIEMFVDAVRDKGYITPQMYTEFNAGLGQAMNGFEIELEHRHKVYQPEYSDPADMSTFLGTYTVHYNAYYNNTIMDVLFPAEPATVQAAAWEERKYKLSAGDFFAVRVASREEKPSSVYSRLLYGESLTQADAPLEYGGMVLNEDY